MNTEKLILQKLLQEISPKEIKKYLIYKNAIISFLRAKKSLTKNEEAYNLIHSKIKNKTSAEIKQANDDVILQFKDKLAQIKNESKEEIRLFKSNWELQK